ncbi:CusA/CzcA family heavy metal efflux RND transporter [Pontibacter sp. HSC-14F20]|uniref:CusA/CzcA family heavy metal efflux RND transporter n=1 Tax=Pontibacter sp. HSC-14F20 TaxID=2864136 RepID=UPI001C73101D|nr:CusA/CzcA family heavy metal efflux RND transporter [Pontibacter sp. HSC-14F20]MBX0334663.1 CusA/CzcA family heavy metal efflux RND transporter [Pontibacter sp. HSC-14F20]
MFNKIIDFSIHNKLVIGLMVLALIVWGTYSLTQLPVDAVPDITNNQVQVVTSSPTLAAQEVERFITTPIEMALANVPDVIEMRSVSRFGLSVITVVFKDEVDQYLARQMITERLGDAARQIPAEMGTPELAPVTTGLGEIYQYVLVTDPESDKKYSPTELRTIQDWIVRRQLLGTPGVADVSSYGGFLKEYEVAVNPASLRSMNLTVTEVIGALEQNNENTGAAYIEKNQNAFFIRGLGLVSSLEDIEKIVVSNRNGLPVLVRDVAKVQFGHPVRYGALTRNTEGEVVGGIVLMLKGASSSEVIKNVQDKVATIQSSLPEGLIIEAYLDRSDLVGKAINTVATNLIEGGLIVIFVLVLLLGNLRAGLVVASVIPLSMLFALGMMNVFGVSGNLMSLGAIDFGLIVDGAVIIVEGVLHFIVVKNKDLPLRRLTQQEMDLEVKSAASNIMNSAAFGMLIILIVYLPIMALVGIEGKMFKPMAQTVSFAILGAFILSLTYVPMVSTLLLSKTTKHKPNISDRLMGFLERVYRPVITFALRSKALVIGAALVLFAFSLFIFSRMGGEFLPDLEEGDFAMDLRLVPGASLSQTIETTTKASEILLTQFPEVTEVIGKIGTAEIPTDPMPIEAADVMILLKDKDEWTSASTRQELAAKMDEALKVLPGVNYGFQQPIQLRFNELMTGARQDVAIKIFGEDLDQLSDLAGQVDKLIAPVEGVQDIYVEEVTGLPQIVVNYNRARMSQYGLQVADVNAVLRTAFAGQTAGAIYEGDRRFDLVVRMEGGARNDLNDIEDLFVSLPQGGQIPLQQVADIKFEEGPMQISREEGRRRIVVGFNVRERDVESIVSEIQEKLNRELPLPAGYFITYGGQFENLVHAKQRLSVAVPAALLLILLLLYFAFKSVKQSLLIFTAIPLSAIGGIFALWLRDMPFSISAGVGFIALFGVAVLNGIVLIGYFNQLKREGMTNVYERVLLGTSVRLRPVLMTASVAALGFLPMALSGSEGAEVQRPLATVVIGGLFTSTLLTLVVLPVLYYIFSSNEKPTEEEVHRKPIPVHLITILLMVSGVLFSGQGIAQSAQSPLNLEQSINYAREHNLGLKSAAYSVEREQALRGAATDLPKTNVTYSRGQISTVNKDEHISASQQFAFPTVYRDQARLADAHIKQSEAQKMIVEQELIRDVKLAWYSLQYQNERLRLLQQQDSLFGRFTRAATIRFETGETGYLEQATAETRSLGIKTALQQALADQQIAERQLRQLLQAEEPLQFASEKLSKRELILQADSTALAANPYLAFLQSTTQVAERQKQLEQSRLLPDFTVGYFNQTFMGETPPDNPGRVYTSGDRFTGYEVGIAVPLWFGAQRSRIKAARINEEAVKSQVRYQQQVLLTELQNLAQELQKHSNTLAYFEQSALRQAEQLNKAAELSFQTGDIDYVEYVQALDQAFQLRSNYLNALREYNQTIISLEFTAGIE